MDESIPTFPSTPSMFVSLCWALSDGFAANATLESDSYYQQLLGR